MENAFNIERYNKREFLLVSCLFGFAIFNLIKATINANLWLWNIDSINSYRGGRMFFWLGVYTVLYMGYAVAHFVLVKKIIASGFKPSNLLYLGILVTVMAVLICLAEIWSHYSYYYFFKDIRYNLGIAIKITAGNLLRISGLAAIYIFYTLVKHDRIVTNKLNALSKPVQIILTDCYWMFIAWLILAAIIQAQAALALPVIPVYAYLSIRLIPLVKSEGKGFTNYLTRATLIALVLVFSLVLFYATTVNGAIQKFVMISMFYAAFHIFIVAPATWGVYHYRLSKQAEISGLKTALGQSSANLDFLRSQINPHFLFNALNTLYGTALQENADRTGEGIQKLGDMMRFMLHENTQEKISLMREIDYLKNYIDLQKLRTHTSPDIVIQTEIEESVNGLEIAPMLLIPFVENAFKHGISLREASHIKITLHTEGLKLFFDVHNSVHPKPLVDPEKDSNGIGLENVKQRLQLLYPGKHELMIRETSKEFFIHLTIQL